MISHTKDEILKQKNLTEVGLRGRQNFFKKALFLRLFLCQNYETFEVPTLAVFRPLTDLKFGSFIARYLKFKTVSV